VNLRLEDVSFTYPSGVTALEHVSLTVREGEAVALVGENGAGKTTLAKHLNGLLRPTHGGVWVGDQDTRRQSVARLARSVAFVFQNPDEQLFERTVRAEVGFGPRNFGAGPAEIEARVQSALSRLELQDFADRHPYDLHLSQRKRVAMAAALAMNTPILVFDEPTIGQDAGGVALVGGLVESLKAEGRTLVAITHDVDFCAEHFERVVVMADGRLLADGPAGEVLAQGGLLAEAAVEQPQLVRLAAALGWRETPLTVEAFVDLLAARRKDGT
jgi:energy-coupling factor transport system ATP-binding protein